ncbi:hyalin-like [Amphiura filiformis]|uniref:hyalin-like n=1 Tax=Amphiura filiformis TaxID=82378 RepID=UPI003B213CC1
MSSVHMFVTRLILFWAIFTPTESQGSICNFDSTLCGYEQVYDDDFDWRSQSGRTSSGNTGPSSDHTTMSGSGRYIYIEASTPRQPGDKARLLSPPVSDTSAHFYHNCTLQFWYHMYGNSIGALNVYTKSTIETSELIWSLQGNQGNLWHLATFQFTPPNRQTFQIVYEGVVKGGSSGDIALDDISLPICESLCPLDSTNPVVSGCPDDIHTTVELDYIGAYFVNWTEPTATDEVNECIDIIVSHVPSTHLFSVGRTGVAYIFRDQNGNSAICSFDVNVVTVDTTPPSISNCSNNITTSADLSDDGATVSWIEPSATDPSGTPQEMRSHGPSTKFPFGQTLVTYSFLDTSNNTATCNFTVTVNIVDTTPPTVTRCPSDFDSVSGRHVTWREPDVYDLSDNITTVKSHIPGVFLTNQTHVLYTFTDPSGNMAFCRFTINIAYDTTPPVISDCVDIIEYAELGSLQEPVYWTQPSATDDYGRVMLIYTSHTPGEKFQIGTTSMMYLFADDSYNVAYCNFSVVVHEVDTIPPTIKSCPSDIDLEVEPGTSRASVSWIAPSASDVSGNVSLVSQSHHPGDTFPTGRTEVVYSFTDGSNNEAFCSFHVNVREGNNSFIFMDTTPPVIVNCPSDINESTELGILQLTVSWLEPSAVDLRGIATLQSASHRPEDLFPVDSSTKVSYVFIDDSRNMATCNFSVIVSTDDTTPPVISDCVDIIEYAELGSLQEPVYWTQPSATDDYGRVMLIYTSHTPGEKFQIGTTSMMYLFADDSYNVAYCNFSVVVHEVDTIPPTIKSCPSDIDLEVEPGTSRASVSWIAPSASDVSGNVSLVSQSHHPGDTFPTGRTEVVYSFTDGSNNEAFCSFHVNVREGNNSFIFMDTTPPVIVNCPSDINESTELGILQLTVSWLEPSAVDLRGIATLQSASHRPEDLFPVDSSTKVSYVFIDDSRNMATCNFSVIVSTVDTTPPKIETCPRDVVAVTELGNIRKTVYWTEPMASDISGNVTLSRQNHYSGDAFPLGLTDVSYEYLDGIGNTAWCNFSVVVNTEDTIRPTIICPSDMIVKIEEGSTSGLASWREPSAMDASGNVTLLVKTHQPGERFGIGVNTVMYIFADSSNNMAFCTFSTKVTSVDSTPPRIELCPRDMSAVTELGNIRQTVYWIEPIALDISGNVTLSKQSHYSGDDFPLGLTDVSYEYIDGTGNAAWCNFSVVVNTVDTVPPKIESCPRDVSAVTELGNIREPVYWTEPIASDISGNVTLTRQSYYSGDDFPLGLTGVSYEYIDGTGNTAWCNFSVIVNTEDTVAPTITNCPSDIIAEVEEGSTSSPVSWREPSASDASGNVTLIVKTHQSGEIFGIGANTVMYIFADPSNNMAFCTFSVKVTSVDSTPPKIESCPRDMSAVTELGNTRDTVYWTEPIASDISGNVTLSRQSHYPGDDFPLGLTDVSYEYIDGTGNTAWCNFSVVVNTEDTTVPAITNCPSDIIAKVEEGSMSSPLSWEEPSASDASGNVTLIVKTHQSGERFGNGVDTVIHHTQDGDWTEPITSDNSGNVTLSRQSHYSGDDFPIGLTDVIYEYIDGTGNTAWCNFSVVVNTEDTTPPELEFCPEDIYQTLEISTSGVHVSWDEPSASDKSGYTLLVNATHKSGELFEVGSTLVRYTFADGANNTATCEFHIHVAESDSRPPTITLCPRNKTVEIDQGSLGAIVSWDEPIAEDASGFVMLLIQTHASGTFFTIGTTIVSYIFRDKANNMEKCSFAVTVTGAAEAFSKIFNCPSNIVTRVEPGRDATRVIWTEPYAINLSTPTKISSNHKPNESFPIGLTPVVYTFEDSEGHKVMCNFTVVVLESDYPPDMPDKGVVNRLRQSEGAGDGTGVSYAALVLSLLVIVFAIIVMLVLVYFRMKTKRENINLDVLAMSTTTSLKSINL